ncbi:MAG: lysophospholipid acyltransferase family protein [Candidatus Omnitrophota bacterium]
MSYTIARFILFLLFKIFFRLKVFGRENFPKKGAVIVAPNHVSFLDPIIVGIGAPRKLIFLARETLFRSRIFGFILNRLNTFPLKRERGDLAAFRLAIDKLSKGHAVLIFPEGTRSKDGNFQEAKLGISFLEKITGAGILPCYVKGSRNALPRESLFPKFRTVSVYFGKPLSFNRNSPGPKKEKYIDVANKVMEAISELKRNAG